MKNYNRIPLKVKAEQYFPYVNIAIEGFRNILEDMLDEKTMEKQSVCIRAEIVIGDSKLDLHPGDWVIQFPDGTITIRSNANFTSDFAEDTPAAPVKRRAVPQS